MTFTTENRQALEAYLADHVLPSGLGTEDSACTVAAINLSITGELTDTIPKCMSKVIGKAAIVLQDGMPDEMRNSPRYKTLIPNMAGTGRELEKERLEILVDWMWDVVLPTIQPIADKKGFGGEWSKMCESRSMADARSAADNNAARSAAYAAAARSATYAAGAAARSAAYAAVYIFGAYADDSPHSAADEFWETVDPIGVLERMTYLGKGEMK